MTLEERIKELEEENKNLNEQLELSVKGSAIQYNKVRKLEKAFDKACELLSVSEQKYYIVYPSTIKNWKDSLLRESEKQ